jgi:hypothetical protein
MAKRFTDASKFNDTWYRRLTPLQKVIWEFLISECNHAGILKDLDFDLMSFKINEKISRKDFEFLDERIKFLNDTTIYITKFISFQYGILNPLNRVHASVLKELKKWNLQAPCKPLASPYEGFKDKDKDKDITLNKQIDTLNNINNNEKNLKKSDPYVNPIHEFFIHEYQKVFEHKPYLMHNQRMKLVELAAEIDDFKETIPIALEKLKNIDFKFSNFTPNYIWLLKDDNYIKVLSGTYDRIKTEWEIYDENYEVDEYGN